MRQEAMNQANAVAWAQLDHIPKVSSATPWAT